MLSDILVAVVLVLALLTFTCLVVEAGTGYEVAVTVDNTTWSIERSTIPVTFEMGGKVRGTGMVMRDTSINNIAGVSAKETTHTLFGVIIISENTTLVSKEEPVVIMTNIKGGDVSTNESVNVTISEAWPTFFSNTKELLYLYGSGISTRERYENNGDVICTSFNVKELAKASWYDTVLLKREVSAEIRPGSVNETICTNKSTFYVLGSVSLGGSAHIGYRSGEGIERVESSETYIGNFKIETAIKMKEEIPPALPTPSPEWLPCPSREP